MTTPALLQQLLPLLAMVATLASAAFEPDVWYSPKHWPTSHSTLFDAFDWDLKTPAKSTLSSSATFASVLQSSKSDSKRSRSEEVKQEVRTHSQSSEWTRGFQDNGKGGLTRLDAASSVEKTTGRSAKELKASESGESSQREQKLTRVGGKTTVSSDTGKQSSFSNSGHLANRTEFSNESSSSDNQLAKVVLPPKLQPPPLLPPPPGLVTCIGRSGVSVVFLAHAAAGAHSFGRLLGLLDVFLSRLAPARTIVIFYNRRVLNVVDSAEQPLEALPRRLAEVAHGLRGHLADECYLPAAAVTAEHLRRRLRLAASPSVLVALAASGELRVDQRAISEAPAAAESVRRGFIQVTPVVPLGQELKRRAADMLVQFSTDRPPALLPLEFGGGARADAQSADILGRRICEAVGRFDPDDHEEPGRHRGDWHEGH